ncbi:MAG: ATP-dependent RecD-like DNA helicase [Planctomycetota bacterium]
MGQADDSSGSTTVVDGLVGTIDRFTFRSDGGSFAVARFLPDDGGRALSIVGDIAQLAEGQSLRVFGRRSLHPRFGPQIEVDRCEATLPISLEGLRAYLSSSLIQGVGPALAERIVDEFGSETLEVIENEPERLREIPGLGEKKAKEVAESVRSHRQIQEVTVFLRAHGLGPSLAARIVERLGSEASARIQADPYRLVDQVVGVGFTTADRLAQRLGIASDAEIRLRAALVHELTEASLRGHCALPEPELLERSQRRLKVDADLLREALGSLCREGQTIRETIDDTEVVYPLRLHLAESEVATMLHDLASREFEPVCTDVEQAIDEWAARSNLDLAPGQRHAIRTVLESPLSAITGGPGVGKTTVVRAIADLLSNAGQSLRLAAPTGRAAKRLEEATDRSASTLHRLLEYQPGLGRFARDPDTPLEGEVLIVDESSMLDLFLAHDLLRAIPEGMRLVFVGDVDQLPSVGPGRVLGELIDSGVVPVARPTDVFRQAAGSQIVRAAHEILDGEPPMSGPEGSDFYFIEADDAHRTRKVIVRLLTERIPAAFGLDPLRDVQILVPMYRGGAGADALNIALQNALNPKGPQEHARGDRLYRVGDKVIQVRNDYDLDLFNGDVGKISGLDRSTSKLRVDFDGREVDIPFGSLDQIQPAYAITIHRSQGSEYPAVIVPVLTEHAVMLRRQLIYTAVTRGKQLVVLVGSKRALDLAVRRTEGDERITALADRLRTLSRG